MGKKNSVVSQIQLRRRRFAKALALTGLLSLMTVLGGGIVWFSLNGNDRLAAEHETVSVAIEPQIPNSPEPFPVSVDPANKLITESPIVDAYFKEHVLSRGGTGGAHTGWLHRVAARLALSNVFQNLASLTTRTLVIQSGERKEQVAENFGKILKWDRAMRTDFLSRIASSAPMLPDGKFFPSTYTVARDATPADVAQLVLERFNAEVLARYDANVTELVPLETALTVASLLEREASDFADMRQISGVIWNRLFVDMDLQIDATLQYAKGSRSNEPWWPKVRPADKYIDSPYNTYKNAGLPPAPIANPSLDSILAALNPKETDCMYYFHDRDGEFHCSKTYEEHVSLLKEYYGKGR